MAEQLKDLARSTLAGAFTAGDAAIQVLNAGEFPPTGTFSVRLDNPEKTLLTVNNVNGNVLQVTPELNLAGAQSGALVVQVLTTRVLRQFVSENGGGGSGGLTLPLSVAQGGTGAADAAGARTNLGIPNLPLQIFQGGTGGTTAGQARTNLDVYSKAEIDALALGGGSIVLPLALSSGGTGATTAEQARINLGIKDLFNTIKEQGLVLQNNTPIYWLNAAGQAVGVIWLDPNNDLIFNPPGGDAIFTGNILVRNNYVETSVRTRSMGAGPSIMAMEAETTGEPRLLFHKWNVNWYSIGLRKTDSLLAFTNSNNLDTNLILWYNPGTLGWHIPTGRWLYGGNTQLVGADASNNMVMGGNAAGIFAYSALIAKVGFFLENSRALYGLATDGNYRIISYVDSSNVLVVGDPALKDMVINRSFIANGLITAVNGMFSGGPITMRIMQPVRDEWNSNWIYRTSDGGWNALRFMESAHLVAGDTWTIIWNRGNIWNEGYLDMRAFGTY